MEFFTAAIDILKTGVLAVGAFICVAGIITYGLGHSADNPGQKNQGLIMVAGGGIVVLVAYKLVPQLATLFG